MDVRQLVLRCVKEIAEGLEAEITLSTKLHADLGFDSLDYVELVIMIEEDSETKQAFRCEDIPAEITVGELAEKVGPLVVI